MIHQEDDTGCGLACVAMIAQVTYKEAKATVFPTATPRKLTFYTRTYQIRKALRGLGIPVAARSYDRKLCSGGRGGRRRILGES